MRGVVIMTLLAVVVAALSIGADQRDALPKTAGTGPRIEVVFVLDTTGSMSGLIAAAKEKIWAIANTLATTEPAPQIRMGIVGYRDRGDAYVTKRLALTEDLDAVFAFLMKFQADGGGDGPESVNQALHEAVVHMAWSTDEQTYRVVFLVGDSPPHMDYANDVKYPQSCKLAAERGIMINTIQCGNQGVTTPIWSEIARKAEGQFFRVEQSGGAIVASTPFDAELRRLSRELDGTRIYYGTAEDLARQEARETLSSVFYREAPSSALAARVVFNASESGRRNFVGGKELVDDVTAGRVSLSEIESDKLKGELASMSPAEREAHVKKLAAQRTQLQQQIAELSGKRQAHIRAQIEKAGTADQDSLDVQLYNCIKSQAHEKHIIYEAGPRY